MKALISPTLSAADRIADAAYIRLSQGATGAPWIESSIGPLLSTAGLMPLGSLLERHALARRLVACLQVCQGLDVETIEAAVRDRQRPIGVLFDRRLRASVRSLAPVAPAPRGLVTT